MGTVLIVDDNLEMCRVLARLVRAAGHAADVALGGQEAIDYLQSNMPDIIILDLMMPRIDGLDVLRTVRDNPGTARVPVIMFTAAGEGELRDRALRSGANDYWLKGAIDFTHIKQQLSTYLDRA